MQYLTFSHAQKSILLLDLLNFYIYAFGYNLEEINNILPFDFELVSKWFQENYMVLNANKCHFMCLGSDTENETIFFNNLIFNNSNEEKILGITIDNKLTFDKII